MTPAQKAAEKIKHRLLEQGFPFGSMETHEWVKIIVKCFAEQHNATHTTNLNQTKKD